MLSVCGRSRANGGRRSRIGNGPSVSFICVVIWTAGVFMSCSHSRCAWLDNTCKYSMEPSKASWTMPVEIGGGPGRVQPRTQGVSFVNGLLFCTEEQRCKAEGQLESQATYLDRRKWTSGSNT